MSTSKKQNQKNKKNSSLFRSARTVSSATAFSRVLGLVREQVIAWYFGASTATDAYNVAYKIPNLLRDMFAEGALSSAFVPVFKEKLVQSEKSQAFRLANLILGAVLLVVGLIVIIGIIAAPALVYLIAQGFVHNPDQYSLTVSMTRLMAVYLLLVSLSALVMGMLNSFGKFGLPAFSPAMFNIGSILSVLALYHYLDVPIYAIAIGVVVGGIGQLVIQLPVLFRLGFRFRPKLDFLDEGVKKVLRLFMPIVIGMSAGRVNIMINVLLASFLAAGSISYLTYAYRLMHFPLGVFAVALGTVALPQASEMVARNDMKGLRDTFRESINLNLLLILPSVFVLAIWGERLVGLIFEHGAFSGFDTTMTARALFHYSYGLIGFAAVRVTTPIFYALGDSKLPMKISVATVLINIVLYWPLIQLYDFAGLASATSIAAIINWIVLLYFLPRKGVPISYGRLGLGVFRIGLASWFAVMGADLIPFDLTFGQPGTLGGVIDFGCRLISAGLLYLMLCLVFRVRELSLVLGRFSKRR